MSLLSRLMAAAMPESDSTIINTAGGASPPVAGGGLPQPPPPPAPPAFSLQPVQPQPAPAQLNPARPSGVAGPDNPAVTLGSAPHPVRPAGDMSSRATPGSVRPDPVFAQSQSADSAGPRDNAPHQDEYLEEEESFFEEMLRETPAWLISLVLHLFILLILAFITFPTSVGSQALTLFAGTSDPGEQFELAEFTIDPVELDSIEFEESAPDITSPSEEVLASKEAFEIKVVPIEQIKTEVATAAIAGEAANVEAASGSMFAGRSGATKQALLDLYGGTPQTVEAVKLGLEWLARNQLDNGKWSLRGPYSDGAFQENYVSATAMALIAFLGDGHTQQSGDYIENVSKGLDALLGMQIYDGGFDVIRSNNWAAYAHAQATIALCECYAITGESRLRAPCEAALRYCIEAQSPQGGWRYVPRGDSDTSVTGWYVMALKSGESAGFEIPTTVWNGVSRFLDSVGRGGGAAYAYVPTEPPSTTMTAEGMLCRQYLGWLREHPAMSRGLELLIDQENFSPRTRNVYYWYYATQALHHYGGNLWDSWNEQMRVDLPAMQIGRGREVGSWAPQGDRYGQQAGRLYTTCLSIYCLEVYYRHMPLYKFQLD
ncbi:MAG: prenyltransferase/squalene oxidase repeat-containing protein [Planctomycetota bacterium]